MSDATGQTGVQQWLRKISLIAAVAGQDGIELSNLRVKFTVTKMLVDMPSTLDVTIYNLADSTAKKLLNMPTIPKGQGTPSTAGGDPNAAVITLRAGYEGNYGVIFRGNLIQPRSGRESTTDTFVKLFCGDGDWAHVWGRINRTLAAAYTPDDVNGAFKDTSSEFNQTVNDLPPDVQQQAAPRGKTMYGMARDYRRDFAQTYQLSVYPRDGTLEWLPQSAYRPGDIVEVTYRTGMIGMPQQTVHGFTVQMLLNPSVGPGTLLRVNNASIQRQQFETSRGGAFQPNFFLDKNLDTGSDGSYKVLWVEHVGDTRGNEWYTTVECISTTAGQALGQKVPPNYGTVWQ